MSKGFETGRTHSRGKWFYLIALSAIFLLRQETSLAQGLGIFATNNAASVSWPLGGYYYLLQTATNLSGGNSWITVGAASPVSALATGYYSGSVVPTLTNFGGNNIIYTQQVANAGQFFRLRMPPFVPVFCFAIFYDQLLEFSDSPTLAFNGLIHANGSVYTGPSSGVSEIFNGTVTATGTITSPPNAGIPDWAGQVLFNGNPPFITNVPAFILPGVTNNPHVIIEIPPANENPDSAIGQLRLYNQAEVVLIVSNSPSGTDPALQVILQTVYDGKSPGSDPAKIVLSFTNVTANFLNTNGALQLPFLSLTNTFTDQRESKPNMFVTQIDIGKYALWLSTNYVPLGKFFLGMAPTLYVADRRNTGNSKLSVVRLVNGSKLPNNMGLGFTVATQNPLYVKGNYNITIDGVNSATTLGSTTNGFTAPAALMADAITILSPSWQDGQSAASYTVRDATSMTVNAAFLTGTMPSTGSSATTFSGGVHNLTRFLEDWTSATLVYNTSLVCLYSSQMATNQFQLPGVYYFPPMRRWGFDANFLNLWKLPPSSPIYLLP